jgi:hypothetical protein
LFRILAVLFLKVVKIGLSADEYCSSSGYCDHMNALQLNTDKGSVPTENGISLLGTGDFSKQPVDSMTSDAGHKRSFA